MIQQRQRTFRHIITVVLLITLVVFGFPLSNSIPTYAATVVSVTDPDDFGTLTSGRYKYYNSDSATNRISTGLSLYKLNTNTTYVLENDINLSGKKILVENGVTATIDLNGHTLDEGLSDTPKPCGFMIHVESGGILCIKDSSDSKEGVLTGGNNSAYKNYNTASLIESGGDLYLNDITVTGNSSDNGYCSAAINVKSGCHFRAEGVNFSDNSSKNSQGACVAAYACDADVIDCTFSNNDAYVGAAIYSNSACVSVDNTGIKGSKSDYGIAAILAMESTISISNTEVHDNETGALDLRGGSATVRNCEIYNNISSTGNMVAFYGSSAYDTCVEVDSVNIYNNTAKGAALANSALLTVKDCTMVNNIGMTGIVNTQSLTVDSTVGTKILNNKRPDTNEDADVIDYNTTNLKGKFICGQLDRRSANPIEIKGDLTGSDITFTNYVEGTDENGNTIYTEAPGVITNGYKQYNPDADVSDHFSLNSQVEDYMLLWNGTKTELRVGAHEHDWVYTKSTAGDTIHVSCSDTDFCEFGYENPEDSTYIYSVDTPDSIFSILPYSDAVITSNAASLTGKVVSKTEYFSISDNTYNLTAPEDSGSEIVGGAPVYVGDYAIRVYIDDTTYVEDTFSINQATPELLTTPAAINGTVELDDADEAIITEGTTRGGYLEYKLNSEAWSEDVPARTDLVRGENTIKYRIHGDRNHEDKSDDSWTFNIQADVPVYTVTFSNSNAEAQDVERGSLVSLPDVIRQGYNFLGWFTDEDCTVAFDDSTPILADTTIYAKWVFVPTNTPTPTNTPIPTSTPTPTNTPVPTSTPTVTPTLEPTPTVTPTVEPTCTPTVEPTLEPTSTPTPTVEPTSTIVPTLTSTNTVTPTLVPTSTPASSPTVTPTLEPTLTPTNTVTPTPTMVPEEVTASEPKATITPLPTVVPSAEPTLDPTVTPTLEPTPVVPTLEPTSIPTVVPTLEPTSIQTVVPSAVPITTPTVVPTEVPTTVPTLEPTSVPTLAPTLLPTVEPTVVPTEVPTIVPVITQTPADPDTRFEDSLQDSSLAHMNSHKKDEDTKGEEVNSDNTDEENEASLDSSFIDSIDSIGSGITLDSGNEPSNSEQTIGECEEIASPNKLHGVDNFLHGIRVIRDNLGDNVFYETSLLLFILILLLLLIIREIKKHCSEKDLDNED